MSEDYGKVLNNLRDVQEFHEAENLGKAVVAKLEAEDNLPRYAHVVKDWGIHSSYRVKAAPIVKGRYQGTWGVWLNSSRSRWFSASRAAII